jgi:hypothetical protein
MKTVLPEIGNASGIVGVHFCAADGAASEIPTVEKTFRKSKDMCPPYTVMIEGSSQNFIQSAAAILLTHLTADVGIYQLENTRSNLNGAYNGNGVYGSATATTL